MRRRITRRPFASLARRQRGRSPRVFSPEKPDDLSDLVGTSITDNDIPVRIVGIFEDVHYESLYKELRPMGLWTSAKNHYRRSVPERYAYVKIAGGNPRTAIEHIRKVTDELIPGYPADIHFFDTALEELYSKSGGRER